MDAQQCIRDIRGNQEQRSRAIGFIFQDQKLRRSVRNYVMKYGGQKGDVELVYDDMITQFVKMVFRKDGVEIKSELNAYLLGIARMLWKQELRKRNVHQKYVDQTRAVVREESGIRLENLLFTSERKELLDKLLEQVGQKCKSVLMRWAYGYSMKEIAVAEAYKSDMMARKKKSKCLKALKEYISVRPEIIRMFS